VCGSAAYPDGVDEDSLETELLRIVRRAPGRRADELAELLGLPRTNFGRALGHRLSGPLDDLLASGLVQERGGRYRISERGRRRLADDALNG
jgi:DNA-binding IclR family transcriptional regulator